MKERHEIQNRKKRNQYLFYILCLVSYVLFVPFSEGAFRDSFSGARSMAMGGAHTALANDADGVLANPAGLSMIKSKQVIATGAILYAGLSDNLTSNILGYAYQSSKVGALGAIWKRFSAGDLYHENIVFLSHARRLGLYFTKKSTDRRKNVSLGVALRFMSWDSAPTIGPDGRIIEDLPGWRGISGDIGLVIWPSENTPVAIVFQNVTRPDTASKVSKVKERLSMATRMGVATIGEKTTWAMDMILKNGEIDLRTGLERQMYNGDVLVRAGLSLENLAWGMNFTVGAGYKPYSFLRIDYALVYPVNTIEDTMGSHRVTVVYSF